MASWRHPSAPLTAQHATTQSLRVGVSASGVQDISELSGAAPSEVFIATWARIFVTLAQTNGVQPNDLRWLPLQRTLPRALDVMTRHAQRGDDITLLAMLYQATTYLSQPPFLQLARQAMRVHSHLHQRMTYLNGTRGVAGGAQANESHASRPPRRSLSLPTTTADVADRAGLPGAKSRPTVITGCIETHRAAPHADAPTLFILRADDRSCRFFVGARLQKDEHANVHACLDASGRALVDKSYCIADTENAKDTLSPSAMQSLQREIDLCWQVHAPLAPLASIAAAGRLHVIKPMAQGHFLSILKKVRKHADARAIRRSLARQITENLVRCEAKNVVHRDLKLSTIMWGERGDMMLDHFGRAMYVKETAERPRWAGAPAFCAPEAMQGVVDTRSDLWSLGAILLYSFVGLSGAPLFAKTPQQALMQAQALDDWQSERQSKSTPWFCLDRQAAFCGRSPWDRAFSAAYQSDPELALLLFERLLRVDVNVRMQPRVNSPAARPAARLLAILLGLQPPLGRAEAQSRRALASFADARAPMHAGHRKLRHLCRHALAAAPSA